jgi:hypothetical protein
VKQIAGKAHIRLGQQLAGIAFPSVLLAVEPDQTADKEYGQRDVRIHAENEVM